jgi:ribosome-binding factor A
MKRGSGFKRKDRVASEIKKAVSYILEVESGNERLKGITLTDVEMTPDLRIARVFVSSQNSSMSEKDTLKELNNAKGFIKKNLSKRVRIKYMPQIEFEYDDSIEYGFKIDTILNEIKGKDNEEESVGDIKE